MIAGQSLRADAQGQVGVPAGSAVGAFVDLIAPGFLDRQTSLRAGGSPFRISLWPRTSAAGLNENFTATLVYTSTADGATVGGLSLRRHRPGSTAVYVVLSPALRGDAESVAWHQLGSDSINVATNGKIIYRLSTDPPAGATVIDVSYDPANPGCTGARGFSSVRLAC